MEEKRLKYRIRYIKTLDEFNGQMSNGLIGAGDIVFIEETGLIWTHSKLFGSEVNLDVVIENSLESEDITKALSAYQGKRLNEKKVDKTDLEIELSKKASLDKDGLIPMSQLPSKVQRCAYYLGIWDANDNSPVLDNQDKYDEGSYFVVRNEGSRFGYTFRERDIVIKANGTWIRIMGSTYYESLEVRIKELERLVKEIIDGDKPVDPGVKPEEVSIISFTMDCDEFNEIGSTVNPNFNWVYSTENITSQSFNGEPLDIKIRTKSLTNIKDDTEFKLTVSSLNTASGVLDIHFVPRIYFGASEVEDMTSGLVPSLGGDEVVLNRILGRKSFNCTGGKYVYYIVPTSEKDEVVIRDGNDFLFTGYTTSEVKVTNTYGVETSYTVFKTNNMYYSEEVIFKFE